MLALDVSAPRVVDQKYELVELLGLGSMGEVWTARHVGLDQTCAVKLIARETHESPAAAILRFTREARIAAALSRKTRHIVAVTDFGSDDGGPYLVMELLDGQALDECLVRGCTTEEASLIVSQIAKGLGVAHREGILHRDLKPANVFLTRGEDGERVVKLLDFGIARLMVEPLKPITVKGVVVGSPAYMSPEHVCGESLDARADVWSLAVLAFETLTGELPFAAETTHETLRRIAMFEATPVRKLRPDASPALEAFFARAFARNIEDRFQKAEDLSRAFSEALAPKPIVVEAPQRDPRIRTAAIAVACALVVFLAALFVARMSSFSDVHAPVAEERTYRAQPITAPIPPPPLETPSSVPEVTPPNALPLPPPPSPSQKPIARPQKPNVDPSSIF